MNVLLDLHHHDLFRSLYILFHRRLGANIYLPKGLEWNTKHNLYKYPSIDTVKQYLTTAEGWLNFGFDLPNVRFLTLDEYKDIDMDISVASLLDNIFSMAEINKTYGKKTKEIIQVGNNFPAYIIDEVGKNLLSSSTVVYHHSAIKNKIFYHQEFDTSLFTVPEIYNPKRVYSFQHFFATGCPPFQKDLPLYKKLKEDLSDFDFRCYGLDGEYGCIHNTPTDISSAVKESGFIFHVKPQGDGFGHIYHNAYACGKPVIYKSEYLYFNEIPMTPVMLFDDETSIDLSKLSIESAGKKIRQFSENYSEITQKVFRKFKTVVDYDMEFSYIQKFIENLV